MKKITKIEECKRNKDRVNIYTDEEFYASCSKYCCVKYELKAGMEFDEEYLKNVISEDNYGKGKEYALRIIERGMKSKKELQDKLRLKEYGEKDTDRIIHFMEEYGYIDDAKYARYYIESYKNSKSKLIIKHSLMTKGIDQETIEKYLPLIKDETEKDKIKALAVKKYKSLKGKNKNEIRRKLSDMLFRRGYEYHLIKEAVNEIIGEDEGGGYYD